MNSHPLFPLIPQPLDLPSIQPSSILPYAVRLKTVSSFSKTWSTIHSRLKSLAQERGETPPGTAYLPAVPPGLSDTRQRAEMERLKMVAHEMDKRVKEDKAAMARRNAGHAGPAASGNNVQTSPYYPGLQTFIARTQALVHTLEARAQQASKRLAQSAATAAASRAQLGAEIAAQAVLQGRFNTLERATGELERQKTVAEERVREPDVRLGEREKTHREILVDMREGEEG